MFLASLKYYSSCHNILYRNFEFVGTLDSIQSRSHKLPACLSPSHLVTTPTHLPVPSHTKQQPPIHTTQPYIPPHHITVCPLAPHHTPFCPFTHHIHTSPQNTAAPPPSSHTPVPLNPSNCHSLSNTCLSPSCPSSTHTPSPSYHTPDCPIHTL